MIQHQFLSSCSMDFLISMDTTVSPYDQLFRALLLIPVSHYLLWTLLIFLILVYNLLEIHFLHDFITGFRGDPVSLTCNFSSQLYQSVGAKCQVLHGRYLSTPWLSGPHIQTAFFSFFGRAPHFTYKQSLVDHVTSNFVESFNASLDAQRNLPILSMFEAIRREIMLRICNRGEAAEQWKEPITPSTRKKLDKLTEITRKLEHHPCRPGVYEVPEFGRLYVVELDLKSCDCGMWAHTGIPCKHGLVCLMGERRVVLDYVDGYFRKEVYQQVYSNYLNPVPDKLMWPQVQHEPIMYPIKRKLPGRPRMKRIKGADDPESSKTKQGKKPPVEPPAAPPAAPPQHQDNNKVQKPNGNNKKRKKSVPDGRVIRCGNCKEVGHNRKGCPKLVGDSACTKTKMRPVPHACGGTIALDCLRCSDGVEGSTHVNDTTLMCDTSPIVLVIPGLTSDSSAAYIKHLAIKLAKKGWNVIVSNHRGLGGISVTSDCFYNAGWTEDIRKVIDHIHSQYPEAPLFVVGTSIGANVLVKYLGENGVNTPIIGAAAVCCPWDLLICDRFLNRNFIQKFYDKVLVIGLQGYAQLHQSVLYRLADWEGIEKSRSVREFDNHATRVLGKFETVDTFYRHSSCASFVGNVSVPLLCISALDDPVCTKEAIPWDECKANENIILATTKHGGHLAFYEGINATSMWWVRAVDEFLGALHSCPFANRTKVQGSTLQSSIDQGPYVNVEEDGMVAAISTVAIDDVVVEDKPNAPIAHIKKDEATNIEAEKNEPMIEEKTRSQNDLSRPSEQNFVDLVIPLRRRVGQLLRHSRISIWLLACIAITTTWPFVGSALSLFLKRRFKSFPPPMAILRR